MAKATMKAKEKTITSQDEMIKLQVEVISTKNAELYALKCRLDLMSVLEDFKNRAVAKNIRKSQRESKWDDILRTNQRGISHHLINEKRSLSEDEINYWITVAQRVYKISSDSIHNYSPLTITVNRVWLKDDDLVLAVAVCKAVPVKYVLVEV